MTTATLEERYAANLHGVLSCFDRIIIIGTLPGACYAEGMTSYLYAHGIRIFDTRDLPNRCGSGFVSGRKKSAPLRASKLSM